MNFSFLSGDIKDLRLHGVTTPSSDPKAATTASSDYALTQKAVVENGLRFSSADIAAFGFSTRDKETSARYAVSFCTPDGSKACTFTKPRRDSGHSLT